MRGPKCDKSGLKKGAWSADEDQKLVAYIKRYSIWNWTEIPKHAGLSRTGKSCRLRWMNYLCPDIKRGNITKEEEDTIIELHKTLGNRWSTIASKLHGRTDNEIKNYWHTHLKKHIKDNTPMPEIEPQERGTSNCEDKLKNSHIDTNVRLNISPIFSGSEGSFSVPLSPDTSLSEWIQSSSGPDFGVDEEQKIEVNNIEQNGELHYFLEELPLLCKDLSMEDEIAAFVEPKVPQEWCQEPLIPYTFNMCDYWLNLFLQADMSGMEEPNNVFF
ncbi:hypothetical protein LguiA_025278 [Lonicera macranthoides]